MCTVSLARRLPVRLLSGILLIMAFLDVPVAAWPEPVRLIPVLVALGVLVAALLRVRGRDVKERPAPVLVPSGQNSSSDVTS